MHNRHCILLEAIVLLWTTLASTGLAIMEVITRNLAFGLSSSKPGYQLQKAYLGRFKATSEINDHFRNHHRIQKFHHHRVGPYFLRNYRKYGRKHAQTNGSREFSKWVTLHTKFIWFYFLSLSHSLLSIYYSHLMLRLTSTIHKPFKFILSEYVHYKCF